MTPVAVCPTIRHVSPSIEYRWRGPVSDAEMMTLITAHGGQGVPGWWDQIRPYSLGWVTARLPGGGLAGFFQSTPAGLIHLPTHGHDRKPAG